MNQSFTHSTIHRNDDGKTANEVELVNARELAKLLSISERTLYRLKSTGELPLPVVLGGSVRWRLTEIRLWIAKGCPRPVKPK